MSKTAFLKPITRVTPMQGHSDHSTRPWFTWFWQALSRIQSPFRLSSMSVCHLLYTHSTEPDLKTPSIDTFVKGFPWKKRQGSIFVIVCLTWQTTCRTKVAYLYLVDQKVYEKLCILTAAKKKKLKKKMWGRWLKNIIWIIRGFVINSSR